MIQLSSLISGTNPQDVIKEIKQIYSLMAPSQPESNFDPIYADVVALFKGQYPGFRASNTKYHDLEHTNLVVLAVTRLMHGCFLQGHAFIPENFFLGFASALFHDVGLIQAASERERLTNDFSGIAACMRLHFKHRWNEDRDLYSDAITNNINYLKCLSEKCRDNYSCYLQNLRRGGIVEKNYSHLID